MADTPHSKGRGRAHRQAALRRGLTALALGGSLLGLAQIAAAGEARPAADDPEIEQRMLAVASELRCVVCQNQTVADSHADLAADLRQQIRDQLAAGRNEAQVREFMTARYGDFVLYRPPFTWRTALLWLGPAGLVLLSVGSLWLVLRRRSRLADAAFDPDTDEPEDADSARTANGS